MTKNCAAEKEAKYLSGLVGRSGLLREAYMRSLLDNIPFDDAPPPDYAALTKKLRPIGESLNQIARKAHVLNAIDTQQYEKTIAMYNEAVAEIIRAADIEEYLQK